jgi:hypoxanthine phosphoribosyltransferase
MDLLRDRIFLGLAMSGSPFDSPLDPRVRAHEFLELDWEMFGELCRALAMRVSRDFHPEVVVGVARAGVIPAAIIASLLRIPFHAITISRRNGEDQVRERPEIFSQMPRGLEGKRVLLVDEIATSGDTLRIGVAALRQVHPAEIRTAVTFARPQGYRPDYMALETDTTVVFPWDVKVFDGESWVINPRYGGAFPKD